MVGLVPTIHDFLGATETVVARKVVDASDERGHDDPVERASLDGRTPSRRAALGLLLVIERELLGDRLGDGGPGHDSLVIGEDRRPFAEIDRHGPAPIEHRDQIGIGDGEATTFQLVKTYGGAFAPYVRPIVKPVAGSVRVAVDGVELEDGFSVDVTTGVVTFETPPGPGDAVTAGFLFDVPVRFDTDYLEVDLSAFAAGAFPKIPLVEIRV